MPRAAINAVMPSVHNTAAQPAAGQRRLNAAAGFVPSAAQAQQMAQDLRLAFDLDGRQVTVLSPSDVAAQRFDPVLRLPGRSGNSSRLLASADERHGVWALVLAGALGLVVVLALLALGLRQGAMLAGLAGVVLAAVLMLRWRPQPKRFERTVQAHLARGAWAVLVCDVPGALQSDVLTALRYNSRRWCADAPRRRRL